ETGLPEKYSVLAANVTWRGSSAGSRNESITERWLAARIAGPVRGTWAAPDRCGLHMAWVSGTAANLTTLYSNSAPQEVIGPAIHPRRARAPSVDGARSSVKADVAVASSARCTTRLQPNGIP